MAGVGAAGTRAGLVAAGAVSASVFGGGVDGVAVLLPLTPGAAVVALGAASTGVATTVVATGGTIDGVTVASPLIVLSPGTTAAGNAFGFNSVAT